MCDCHKHFHHFALNILQSHSLDFSKKITHPKSILTKAYDRCNILIQKKHLTTNYLGIIKYLSKIDIQIKKIITDFENLVKIVYQIAQMFQSVYNNGNPIIYDELTLLLNCLHTITNINDIYKHKYESINFGTDIEDFLKNSNDEYKQILAKIDQSSIYIFNTLNFRQLKNIETPNVHTYGCLTVKNWEIDYCIDCCLVISNYD
jgi:hypothetical protein